MKIDDLSLGRALYARLGAEKMAHLLFTPLDELASAKIAAEYGGVAPPALTMPLVVRHLTGKRAAQELHWRDVYAGLDALAALRQGHKTAQEQVAPVAGGRSWFDLNRALHNLEHGRCT